MSFIRPWAIWRRIQYTIGFFLFWGLLGGVYYFSNFYQVPNCLDGIMNGDETGVDCGGRCVRVCAVEVLPPKVIWAESFEITEGQYNAVAYIENQNIGIGVKDLRYTFELFSGGEKIGERKGITVLPPDSVYPVFEGRIQTNGSGQVDESRITIEPVDYWLPSSFERNQFRSTDIDLSSADDKPRLAVEIENNALTAARDVEVVATIFNEAGNPVTASKTVVEFIAQRSSQEVVFTWPNPIAKTVKNCVIPTDVVMAIDLSGSMNNDGDNPPQPISQALDAASIFVGSLKEDDQVGVVTFATEARLDSTLNNNVSIVSRTIEGLSIDPAEETGFTNTVAALRAAQAELSSARHNMNARRVIVLLTDGLPTTRGEDDVVAAAEEEAEFIDNNGVEIYAIGLGNGVDRDFILNIASGKDNAYFAPTGEDLQNIYADITSDLCEVGPTKIDVIPKTGADFAEPTE